MSNYTRIQEALAVASETKALRIGPNIMGEVGELFKSQFPGKKALIVTDTLGYQRFFDEVKASLEKEGVEMYEPFIFDEESFFAEYKYVERLTEYFAGKTDAAPISIGAGTINDLTKLSSHKSGLKYMTIATAASMDGYASHGASITYMGEKQDFDCDAPLAILADTAVIAAAPSRLTAAGYADLFAKVTAGADWILAEELGVDTIDKFAWDITQCGLKEALADPKGIKQGNVNSIEMLVEGLILGGFAMQSLRSSRPASGAEHQFSHVWNMENHKFGDMTPSHGFQVSIGMLAVTAFYEQMLATDMSKLDVEAAVAAWPTWEVMEQRVREIFADTDFLSICLQESKAKHRTKEEIREQLTRLKNNWPSIRNRLSAQLIPYTSVAHRLVLVGAPVSPLQIGITKAHLKETFRRAVYIRHRFTVLDVALRTGYMDQWLDGLFGEGGVWEIGEDA